jgi:hypothetical protein
MINLLSQPRGADQVAYAHTVKAQAPSLSLGGGSDLCDWIEHHQCTESSAEESRDKEVPVCQRRALGLDLTLE